MNVLCYLILDFDIVKVQIGTFSCYEGLGTKTFLSLRKEQYYIQTPEFQSYVVH